LKKCLAPLLASLLFCSCIGVSADITLRNDGSGKIVLEYRVSRMAEALGALDGNERWQTIPAGRADFERSLSRLPGMKLVSFSASEAPSPAGAGMGKDTINRIELEFKDTATLLAFLDPLAVNAAAVNTQELNIIGKRASFTQSGGKNRLSLTLLDKPSEPANPELMELLRQVSRGYEFKLSLDTGGNTGVSLADGNGNSINAPAVPGTPGYIQRSLSGKKVSLSTEIADILTMENGMRVEFDW
jgi:hypothetical protein